MNQTAVLRPFDPYSYFMAPLTVTNPDRNVNIALVWTDRASDPKTSNEGLVVNDIDLLVATYAKGQWYWWTGNYYYDDPNACTRDGYSVRQTNGPTLRFDRGKNNVERINIKAGDIPVGATMLGVKVLAPGVVADGLFPDGNAPQQDFGLVVENAR